MLQNIIKFINVRLKQKTFPIRSLYIFNVSCELTVLHKLRDQTHSRYSHSLPHLDRKMSIFDSTLISEGHDMQEMPSHEVSAWFHISLKITLENYTLLRNANKNCIGCSKTSLFSIF